MKIFGIKLFEKTQLEKNDLIIWNFVKNLSEIEKIKIFNKNINKFKIENQNAIFNDNRLGEDINIFFKKYKKLCLIGHINIEINENFLKEEEYVKDFYKIGIVEVPMNAYTEEEWFFIQKGESFVFTKLDIYKEKEVYKSNTTIYHILVSYMLLNKYLDKYEEVELIEKLKEELK